MRRPFTPDKPSGPPLHVEYNIGCYLISTNLLSLHHLASVEDWYNGRFVYI